MRVAFYCVEGSTLAWQRRLVDEGCDVLVYHKKFYARKVGKGLVNIAGSMDEWLAWGMRDPNTIWFFDCTDAGEIADRLRYQGRFVIGGGTFMDRLENDRPFGAALAERAGIMQPPTREFGTVSSALAFVRSGRKQQLGDGGFAWKSNRTIKQDHRTYVGDAQEVAEFLERVIIPEYGDNVSAIVQERIKGVALSTARWWNGQSFVGPFEGTLEKKGFMNGEKGPATGCSLNLVWFYRERSPKIAQLLHWDDLAISFRAKRAPAGLYDVNAIVAPNAAYFLEWTPRLGIDSELTSQRGIANLAYFLEAIARGQEVAHMFDDEQIYASVRLSVPPYPFDDDVLKTMPNQLPISGADGLWNKHFVAVGVALGQKGLEVADPYGFAGIALASGTSLEATYDSVYSFLDKRLRIPNLQYRTDAVEAIRKDIEKMESVGFGTTPVLEDV